MARNRDATVRSVRRFLFDDDGADLVEYALLATVVAVGGYFVLSDFVLGVDGLLARVVSRLAVLLS
jgi:Flp pilus assembly pilin Flp